MMIDYKSVPIYDPIDIKVEIEYNKQNNPFMLSVIGIFYGPNGRQIKIPGFYNGDNIWIVRFSPNIIGTWQFTIETIDIDDIRMSGTLNCVENMNASIHGALGIDTINPNHFQYEDGHYHFMNAYECDWLWAIEMNKPGNGELEYFLNKIKGYGFNGIITNIYAHQCGWSNHRPKDNNYGPPALYLWEGTNEHPDHTKMNLEFFNLYDQMMFSLHEKGLCAHLLLKVYNKNVNWPDKYSEEEKLFFKYIVSRYQAFPNIVWYFSKEAYYETDKAYIHEMIKLIRSFDGYQRLVSHHDDKEFYKIDEYANELDFCTIQQHDDQYYNILYERQIRKWPIFNSEFGYEFGPLGIGDTTHGIGQTAEEVLRRAYDVACAGGYVAYYYNYTAWDIINIEHEPIGYKYFKIFYDFFSSIKWWTMQPLPEISLWSDGIRCLGNPKKEYVIFVKWHCLLSLGNIEQNMEVYWMDIYSGDKVIVNEPHQSRNTLNAELYQFECPFESQIGILYIKIG